MKKKKEDDWIDGLNLFEKILFSIVILLALAGTIYYQMKKMSFFLSQ